MASYTIPGLGQFTVTNAGKSYTLPGVGQFTEPAAVGGATSKLVVLRRRGR